MNIDPTSLLAGISVTALTGWLGSFLALRKDERSVQVEQVTKERTKWRENIRKLTEEIILIYFEQDEKKTPAKVEVPRPNRRNLSKPVDGKHLISDRPDLASFLASPSRPNQVRKLLSD